jgi:hypothetical protein
MTRHYGVPQQHGFEHPLPRPAPGEIALLCAAFLIAIGFAAYGIAQSLIGG